MTRAVTLAEIADTNTFVVDGANQRVGIASANPTSTLTVGGGGGQAGGNGFETSQVRPTT